MSKRIVEDLPDRMTVRTYMVMAGPPALMSEMHPSNMHPLDMRPSTKSQPIDSGLGEIFERYGFRVNHDLVFDRRNMPGPFEKGGRRLLLSAPVFVSIEPEERGLADSPVAAGVGTMIFPFASSIDLVGPLAAGRSPQGRLWTLARTSSMAWKEAATFSVSDDGTIEEGTTSGRLPSPTHTKDGSTAHIRLSPPVRNRRNRSAS